LLASCASGGGARSRRPVAETPKLEVRQIRSRSNPIIADGINYTTDPAPLVADGTLYVITGRDTASPGVNDFRMPEWQMLATNGDPMAGRWRYYPHYLEPQQVFRWAAPGHAYAAQIVRAPNGKFYLYAPVAQAAAATRDPFGIGVAVARTPLGPWVDAHPAGPIVSQSYPVANDIQNIDPTVLVDDDGRVFLYWGTFGHLKGVELEPDMVTFRAAPVDVRTLKGFFEAAWLFKRNGTYYMAYAANDAGPSSECTEAVYYACIAYGTSPSPLGPWTYRGVILAPVSSTTSHPGIVEFRGAWYITYHTADAPGGGHFRRSVAIDRLEWDDSADPARIRKVVPTGGAAFDSTPTANIASHARLTASNVPVPVQYWLRAVNDGKVRASPLPPDMWATWSRHNPPRQWVMYQWDHPETLIGSGVYFWGDHPAGSGVGVAPPKDWRLEYWDDATAAWRPVNATTSYGVRLDMYNRVTFTPVTTRCLRAVFDASSDGSSYAAVALQEWQVYAAQARPALRKSPTKAASADCLR
jgi:hypothetical protein